jgi:hypothetical protein
MSERAANLLFSCIFSKMLENVLEWTGRMNHIRACAREIVNEEIIFA